VTIHKLSSTNAFVAFDFDDAETSVGLVRCAPKVLQGGAKELARSATYTFALLEMTVGGASAAINAKGDEVAPAIEAFVAETKELVASGRFLPDAGKGVTEADLAPLREADPRVPAAYQSTDQLIVAGAIASAQAALGGLDGRTARIDGPDPLAASLQTAVSAAGAKIVEAVDRADVLFAGTKMGAVDHRAAEDLEIGALVPTHPIPFTTKALLVLQRAGTVVVPDFVSLAGPALAGWADGDPDLAALESATAERVAAIVADGMSHADGLFLGACAQAEAFLSTWRQELPFGRPLAP
jgi:glutamate dehydrogenase/leucine dehydrogenase